MKRFMIGAAVAAMFAVEGHALSAEAHNDAQVAVEATAQSTAVIYGTVYFSTYPGLTPLDVVETFWIDKSWSTTDYTIDVFVSGPKDEDEPLEDTSRYTIVSATNSTAEVIFHAKGIYYVCFNVYSRSTGELVANYKSYDVYVL